MDAIEVAALSKAFGGRKVIDDLSFSLPAGAFLAVFGPNGAGKTTLLRMLATLSRPGGGRIVVDGVDAKDDPDGVRALVGFVSHQPMLYPDLTAEENLIFYGKLYGVVDPGQRARDLLSTMGLSHRRLDSVSTFSRGMVQRVAIARALVHDPAIVLLDEPYTGLDPRGAEILDRFIVESRGCRTLVMVSHDLAKGVRMATHVLVINRGRKAMFASTDELDFDALSHVYGGAVGMETA